MSQFFIDDYLQDFYKIIFLFIIFETIIQLRNQFIFIYHDFSFGRIGYLLQRK
jgi:hypothetical protein